MLSVVATALSSDGSISRNFMMVGHMLPGVCEEPFEYRILLSISILLQEIVQSRSAGKICTTACPPYV